MDKPPYEITPEIVQLIALVSERIGALKATSLIRPSPKLREQNRIKSIHASLKIEGNTLSVDQITALLDKKKVRVPAKDLREIQNAILAYADLSRYKLTIEKSFLTAHKTLMPGLIPTAGAYRKQSVGTIKGEDLEHTAPPFDRVPGLVKSLFKYLRSSKDSALIKGAVFHYEIALYTPS